MSNSTTNPVAGWDGPYIEKEFENPFRASGFRSIISTANANYQFDLDGDGNVDTAGVAVLRVDNVSDTEAIMVSDLLDNDGDETTGNTAWNRAGRVKRLGATGNSGSSLIIYLTRN